MGYEITVNKLMHVLESGDKHERKDVMIDMMYSKTVLDWMFNPSEHDVMNTKSERERLFNLFLREHDAKNLFLLVKVIRKLSEKGKWLKVPRTTLVWLYTMCDATLDVCNEISEVCDREYARGAISKSEAKELHEDADKRYKAASEINRYIDSWLNYHMDDIYDRINLPEEVIRLSFKKVPDAKFMKRDKIGYYLNLVTSDLYEYIDEHDARCTKINWHLFFGELFGYDYEAEVAMQLTLEGTSRVIRDWRNSGKIQIVWNSITEYALSVLDNCGADTLNHMIDLYTKYVSAMQTDTSTLRVDLTKIDTHQFRNIAKAVERASEKIGEMKSTIENKKHDNNSIPKSKTKAKSETVSLE